MALFPAYVFSDDEGELVEGESSRASCERSEAQLLASDGDGDGDELPAAPERRPAAPEHPDFYVDRALDRGNLRVSTLYYPGRPEYACAAPRARAPRPARAPRYFASRAPDAPDAPALAARVAAFRRLLADAPADAALWESFVDFQEACGGFDAALAAAEQAAERLPRSARLRARLLHALRRALPPHAALERLRALLAAERSPRARADLWCAVLRALAAAPGGDAAQLGAAAAAALADTRALPAAYPRLLHALGELLQAAGLSELVVLLVELAVAMNFAPTAAAPFPPPAPPGEPERAEAQLRAREAAALASGLPQAAVWVRVERLRAAAHWRAPGARDAADPQRSPAPHDVADLLRPAGAPADALRLAARLLLLAKVPPLPGTESAARWAGGAAHDATALLPLLAAAGALPAAHGARVEPAAARRALLLLQDPPHYFDDEAGYLRWVEALWDALGARLRGEAALALVCWRVRWLGALAPLAGPAEAARLQARARALLRAAEHPLPYAEFARLELGVAGPERAARVAAGALRAALQRGLPAPQVLYIARSLAEVSAAGAQLSAAGACALVSAVLRRAPPAPLVAPPPAELDAALQECERQCDAIEAALGAGAGADADEDEEEDVAALLLPAAGEWARARALLAAPLRRERLLRRVRAAAGAAGAAARYWEEGGEALAAAAAREGGAGAAARALLPQFPRNARLALESAGAPLWAWRADGAGERLRALTPRGDVAALGALLAPLARAQAADWAPAEAERLARAARRAGGEGALAWALRLEAEARAPRPRLPAALWAALDAVPFAKWLHVRGAAWCGGEAGALADALLERQLRLHALPEELRPPPAAAAPADAPADAEHHHR
ncbi:nuclease SbcCD subunit C-like isoform X1 [Bicyclus anynana]|uniref:Nuclease SbcCD subunit C-like isoform X1 n=1 Tax=Bicyclus anynana TaxID=110368 RepID=A0ABM3LQ21_BICAN|nr:nuclease SbcCD subunit C-like isoform X1 [Bicyclus anynana]